MRILIDTCVLSEIRKLDGNQSVKQAVKAIPSENLFISVITIGEIVKGIELLVDSKRKKELQKWLQEVETEYKDSILKIDLETSRIWGALTASAQQAGKIIPISDGLIAATAKRHQLHIMTRNVSDFEYTGAMIINPWHN